MGRHLQTDDHRVRMAPSREREGPVGVRCGEDLERVVVGDVHGSPDELPVRQGHEYHPVPGPDVRRRRPPRYPPGALGPARPPPGPTPPPPAGSTPRPVRSRRPSRPPARGDRERLDRGLETHGQVQGERAAPPGLALDVDLAAEQVGDLPADRQAEAGAAVLAAGRPVGLLERPRRSSCSLLGGMPMPVSIDLGTRPPVGAGRTRGLSNRVVGRLDHAAATSPGVGELHRVRQQVAQDLLQALLVGDQRRRDVPASPTREPRPFSAVSGRNVAST